MNALAALMLVALFVLAAFAIYVVTRGNKPVNCPVCPPDLKLLPNNDVTANSNAKTYKDGNPFEFYLTFTNGDDYTNFSDPGCNIYICYEKGTETVAWEGQDHMSVGTATKMTGLVHVNAHKPKSSGKPGFGAGKGKVIITSDEFGGGKQKKAAANRPTGYIVGLYLQPDGQTSPDGLSIDEQ